MSSLLSSLLPMPFSLLLWLPCLPAVDALALGYKVPIWRGINAKLYLFIFYAVEHRHTVSTNSSELYPLFESQVLKITSNLSGD